MKESGRKMGLPEPVTQELGREGLFKENEAPTSLTYEEPEEILMRDFLKRLKDQGIEAQGQTGYATNITTPEWVVSVVDQKDVGRVIITSYRNRKEELSERIESLNKGVDIGDLPVLLLRRQMDALQKALVSPNFDNDERFRKTREFLQYNQRTVSVFLSNPPSPTTLCILEFDDRTRGIDRGVQQNLA